MGIYAVFRGVLSARVGAPRGRGRKSPVSQQAQAQPGPAQVAGAVSAPQSLVPPRLVRLDRPSPHPSGLVEHSGARSENRLVQALQFLLIGLIRLYQVALAPLFPPSCRFTPSCSTYTLEAIRIHGPFRGTWLGMRRVLRCHPFHPGGYDPVPPPHDEQEASTR